MRRAWLAELARISSIRSWRTGALLSALVAPLGALLVGVTNHIDETSTLAGVAASGTTLGLVGIGVWSASTTAGEYAYGTMHIRLATGGRRTQIVVATTAAAAAMALVAGVIAAALSALFTWSIQPPGHHLTGNVAGLLIVPIAYAIVAVVGAGIGMISRSPVASIALTVGLLLVPQAAAGLLGGARSAVIGAVPGVVVTEVVNLSRVPIDQRFPSGTSLAVVAMLVVGVAVIVATAVTVNRRDGG